jgi:hypothetical protein
MTGTEASRPLGFSAAATRSETWATRDATVEVEVLELKRWPRVVGVRLVAKERGEARRVREERVRGMDAIVFCVV